MLTEASSAPANVSGDELTLDVTRLSLVQGTR